MSEGPSFIYTCVKHGIELCAECVREVGNPYAAFNGGKTWSVKIASVQQEGPTIVYSCSAHGQEQCPDCSKIELRFLAIDGSCKECFTYQDTGMHEDTCRARIRGTVYANREEALAGLYRFNIWLEINKQVRAWRTDTDETGSRWGTEVLVDALTDWVVERELSAAKPMGN